MIERIKFNVTEAYVNTDTLDRFQYDEYFA